MQWRVVLNTVVLRQNVTGLNLAAMPVEKRPATDSGAPFQEHENGSNSEAASANANFDQMSNQEMRTELQRIGIGLSFPHEVLRPTLKLGAIFQAFLKASFSSTAPVNDDCEAFFCSICIVEYSPSELSRIPRNLACGHSFCTSCLIKSRSQHDHGNSVYFLAYGIKCPTCRSFTLAPTKDNVKALPKNFTAIAMLQSTKRQSIEAQAAASKRRRFDNIEALANAVRMCELLEGRPDISRDPAKAFQMAEEGSQAGCIHSKGILGRCYITGSGVGLDLHRGLELGRDSSLAGSSYGEFVVAFAYENGSGGVRTDLQESVEHYKMAVQHGIAEAQYRLAHVYIRNRYFKFGDKTQYTPNESPAKKNDPEALNLLRLASEQGHADAQISLALRLRTLANFSHSDYSSSSSDFKEAFMMLKLGVKQGSARRHLEGLHSIAHHYTCLGDHDEAFNHYKLASEKGHIESSFALAEMHQKGEVIIEDVAEAINIYMQILENGEVWYRQRSIKAIRDLHLERGNNVEALKWCKRGADEAFADDDCDDLSLLLDVARMYQGWDPRDNNIALKGDGIERDFVEAAKYFKMACELVGDDPESYIHNSAQYELAKMYEGGVGVAQNFTEAVRLLNIGLAQKNADCRFHLACMYEEGRGIAKDLGTAAKLFHDLVVDEHVPAFCRLASMHRDGRGVPQNKQEALRLLQLLEDYFDKNADANYLHASILLENVKDLSKDPTIHAEVMRLLNLAATENYADAQYLLACQLTGGDVEQKIPLLRSASKSNTNATFKLACLLADGEGVACDVGEAATLLMSAVSKGHLESHCRLAEMFEHGKGVAQSIETAALLYGQAAEKQNSNLARMHTHGLGVIQSHSDAFKYCRMAAVEGVAQAKHDLARMYEHGIGTAVVRSEALRWFHEAAAEGHQEAAVALKRLKIATTEIELPESESQRSS